ncbi:membrane protein insertase YidC [Bacillus megaterium]|nr:membrane protein insertase YidC [Priestia megaterium]
MASSKRWLFNYACDGGRTYTLAPLNILQYKNQLSNKRIQPQLQQLKEKYKDKDPESQRQYQREMMELLKENGANPLMGCIPLLVQLPVFSIVYYAIRRIDEISASSFLWLDLGHSDPYFILPIVASWLLRTYREELCKQA